MSLVCAARDGDLAKLKQLLALGVNVESRDSQDTLSLPPLIWACWSGHLNIVRELLAARANVNLKQSDGITALHYACGHGHTEIVHALLAAGADIDSPEHTLGTTELHGACVGGHQEIIRVVLAAGADVATKQDSDRCHTCTVRDPYDVVRPNNEWTLLHVASRYGRPEAVRELLASGAEVDAKNKCGSTPLHYASAHGHPYVVRELILGGACRSSLDNEGRTPKELAKTEEIADMLTPVVKGAM